MCVRAAALGAREGGLDAAVAGAGTHPGGAGSGNTAQHHRCIGRFGVPLAASLPHCVPAVAERSAGELERLRGCEIESSRTFLRGCLTGCELEDLKGLEVESLRA